MKLLSTRRITLLFAACVALLVGQVEAAPARRISSAQKERVGREFKVKVGRTVAFKGESLRLTFTRVALDSRCPKGVECVWAGNAEVMIEARTEGASGRRTLKLNTNASPEREGEARYRRYTVKLVALSPYPTAERKIKPGEYTATLLVSKE